MLSLRRTRGPMGEGCRFSRADLLARAREVRWAVALVVPPCPARPSPPPRRRRRFLRGGLVVRLLCAASCPLPSDDHRCLDALAAEAVVGGLLDTNDPRFQRPERRRLPDVLTAIRLRATVQELGFAVEPNAERHMKGPAEMARLFARQPDAGEHRPRARRLRGGFSLDELRYEYPEEVLRPEPGGGVRHRPQSCRGPVTSADPEWAMRSSASDAGAARRPKPAFSEGEIR